MGSTGTELQPNAHYGQVPFDLFVLEHWEEIGSTSQGNDHQTWDELARRYLSLSLADRWPLYKRVQDVLGEVAGATPLPTPTEEQVGRMLAPYQSIQERNLNAKACHGWNIVWLRTCYDPSLNEKYLEIEQSVGARVELECLESADQVLDDASLYAFKGTDQEVLDQLLLRIPGLTDARGVIDEYGDGSLLVYANGKPSGDNEEESSEDEAEDIDQIASDVQNVVYVVDDEAVEQSIIKVWWYNEHGKIVWNNVAHVPDTDLSGILGSMMDGTSFVEIVGEDSERGSSLM